LAGILKGLSSADLLGLICQVENLYFRRSAVMGKDNKSIESDFGEIARDLYRRGSEGLGEAMAKLVAKTPKDDEFIEQFKRRGDMKDSLARYMLATMKRVLSPGVTTVRLDATLEHVMPKKPHRWHLDQEELKKHPETCTQLGNLTLLVGGDNSALGDKPFRR
jgi:hypothetical protein